MAACQNVIDRRASLTEAALMLKTYPYSAHSDPPLYETNNMKKSLLTLLTAITSLAAFAQGKVAFVNDSLHAYYLDPSPHLLDSALANQPVPLGGVLPSGVTLLVDLYGGTSPGNLYLYSSTTFSLATPGRQNVLLMTLNDPDGAGPAVGLPGGSPAYFQVQIRDAAWPTAALAQLAGSYWGFSDLFTVVPSSTIAYNSIVNPGGSALSTWSPGPIWSPETQPDPGGFPGQIMILSVPEPSALCLTGLGIAALLRRRLHP